MAEHEVRNGVYRKLRPSTPTEFLDDVPGRYMDTVTIAAMLGVTRATLNNWRNLLQEQFPTPEPDGKVRRGHRNGSWGWAWKTERKQEWLAWYANYRANRKQLHCPCCRYRGQPEGYESGVGPAGG